VFTSYNCKRAHFGVDLSDNIVRFNSDSAAVLASSIDSLIVITPANGSSGPVTVPLPLGKEARERDLEQALKNSNEDICPMYVEKIRVLAIISPTADPTPSNANDIKRFSSAKRFASWLRLVPKNKLSGGRIISSKTPKGKNAIALRYDRPPIA